MTAFGYAPVSRKSMAATFFLRQAPFILFTIRCMECFVVIFYILFDVKYSILRRVYRDVGCMRVYAGG